MVVLFVLRYVAERYVGEETTFVGEEQVGRDHLSPAPARTRRDRLRKLLLGVVVEIGRKVLGKGVVRTHNHVVVVQMEFVVMQLLELLLPLLVLLLRGLWPEAGVLRVLDDDRFRLAGHEPGREVVEEGVVRTLAHPPRVKHPPAAPQVLVHLQVESFLLQSASFVQRRQQISAIDGVVLFHSIALVFAKVTVENGTRIWADETVIRQSIAIGN